MKFCLNNLLFSISIALDFIERDIMKVVANHNKRVALVSGKIGYVLGMPDEEIFDLVSYALLHDNGVAASQTNLDPTVLAFEHAHEHALIGEEAVKDFPFLRQRPNILAHHHEQYNGTGYFNVPRENIHIFSSIIFLGDFFDKLYRMDLDRQEIVYAIQNKRNILFPTHLTEAFETVQAKPSFWLDIEDMFIDTIIKNELPVFHIDVNYSDIHNITRVFSNIIDMKSKFTAGHSAGISQKASIMADYYNFDQDTKYKLIIAADLHDVGKLAIPNTILDKNGKLTSSEFITITSHTYFTRRILENIEGFGDITNWAANHHEKLSGGGYPYGYTDEKLDFCSRLMAVIDIYQALTEQRPYRSGMSHQTAINIMTDMANSQYIDKQIVSDVLDVFSSLKKG